MSFRSSHARTTRTAGVLTAALCCLASYGVQAAAAQPTPPAPGPGGATVVAADRLQSGTEKADRALAGAGSIVYIRNNNVYVANPDGSGERRLTDDGTADDPWYSPSEDDDGTVLAVHGLGGEASLVRMDQWGRVLTSFAPPVVSLSLGFARLSPSGGTVAYGSMFSWTDCSTTCHTYFQRDLQYTKASQPQVVSTSQSDVLFASWASDSRTILGTVQENTVQYHDLAQPTAAGWINDCVNYRDGCNDNDLFHFWPTVSRQGDRYASSFEVNPWSGQPQEYLLVRPTSGATAGQPPAVPHDGCVVGPYDLDTPFPSDEEQRVSMPSWSPDGQSLVVAMRDPAAGWSVYNIQVPDLGDCNSLTGFEAVAGGSQPFWSPAPLSTHQDPPPVTKLSYTGSQPSIKGRPHVGKRVHLSLTKAELAQGFTPTADKVRYQWLRDGAPIDGATGAKHRVVKADRHHALSVVVTGVKSGYSPAKVTTGTVKVK